MRDAILAAMKAKGMSQTDLAKASGIPRPNINAYLNGKRNLTADRIERLIAAVGLDLSKSIPS